MSMKSVRAQIKVAMKTQYPFEDKKLTVAEAKKIVKTAEAGPLTLGEVKTIRELHDSAVMSENMPMTRMAPELHGDLFYADNAANKVLEDFFVKHNVPYVPKGTDGDPPAMTLAIPENPDQVWTAAVGEGPEDAGNIKTEAQIKTALKAAGNNRPKVTERELASIIKVAKSDGTVSVAERDMLKGLHDKARLEGTFLPDIPMDVAMMSTKTLAKLENLLRDLGVGFASKLPMTEATVEIPGFPGGPL